eukprot:GEMP01097981.1.p1 GENE.GEMP01097981.1~~GEMP01097981.1.p1  ORF type:complete len:195 (+),score=22.42 GEMP01097981.1:66-650(+)
MDNKSEKNRQKTIYYTSTSVSFNSKKKLTQHQNKHTHTMAVADPSPETSKPTSRFAELYSYAKERFFPLGESFFVCYLLIDLAMYSALFVVARLAFVQSTGREIWSDVMGFSATLLGIWGANNATRPMRLAGAAAFAAPLNKVADVVGKKIGLPRRLCVIALFIVCAGIVGSGLLAWIIATPPLSADPWLLSEK